MSLPVHTVEEVRALEAALARDHDLSPALLMARAGTALLRCLRANWPEARRVLIVAGTGNNGGDGYVLARLLKERGGIDVQVVASGDARAEPALAAVTAWRNAGGETGSWSAGTKLPLTDLIVDALFGIGLSRPPDAMPAALIEALNAHGAPILAVDVPSGIDADSGAAPGVAVRAARTLCLLARKRGLHTGIAVDHAGAISFDALNVPEVGIDDTAIIGASATGGRLLQRSDMTRWLPPRRRNAHKGDHGHVLIVGGDAGMSGAVRLAGCAALRSGAGWVSVATRAAHTDVLTTDRPEMMVHGVEDAPALAPLLARADAIAVGPGMGQGAWAQSMFERVLHAHSTIVVDADALNLLAKSPRSLGRRAVLTPHPGEAARLLGCETRQVEADRLGAARSLARRFEAVVVLKGAGTLIDDGERCFICPYGNPGMASGGMGDALAGVIAAFVGQGLPLFDAACVAVLAHALAGDAAAVTGERGLLAGDLIERLRDVVNP
jgi:NAD(P)H-hydrate epimerase